MEKFNPESRENREEISSKIVLKIFRHGDKEKYVPPGVNKDNMTKEDIDKEIRLTEKGRKQALERSETEDISQAVAFGSQRKRAQETAGLVMSGKLAEITGHETLEQLKEKLDKDLAVGSKVGTDLRLDFEAPPSEYRKKMMDAAGKEEFLKFIVEDSDALAEKLNDKDALTYKKVSGDIAALVEKYISIAPKWDRLVRDKNKNYKDELKRFLGTHMGISETFLAKVIEETKGKTERDVFVAALGNQGFDFVEGYDIEIRSNGEVNQKVHISYKKEKDGKTVFKFDEDVPKEIIEGMIPGEEEGQE